MKLLLEARVEPLSGIDIVELFESNPPRDTFGPKSDRPFVAFQLEGVDTRIGAWLKDLPCPVIGLGHGPLEADCDLLLMDDSELPTIAKNIEAAPIAAMVLVQHLRASEHQDITDALTAESFAYAAIQKGPEFLSWLKNENAAASPLLVSGTPIKTAPDGKLLNIILNDPSNLNAIGTSLRDALCEALDIAMIDPCIERVELSANGRAFSVGGAVEEFGEISDPATAHWVRSLRLPAWRLARMTEKLHVHVNGAAIGAGAEIAAFGKKVTASKHAWFQLPELKYGLIPGAGGTVSLPRRIGRQKTCYMALSMNRINAQTAAEWGLVDEISS